MQSKENRENNLFIAHWRKSRNLPGNKHIVEDEDGNMEEAEIQTVAEHLKNTAELAKKFASSFGAQDIAEQIGMAHDIGKYSEAFQNRIWCNGLKTDHSTAGAKTEIDLQGENVCGLAAAYCISGHHSGLLNGGTKYSSVSLRARLAKEIDNDYQRYQKDVKLIKEEPPGNIKLMCMRRPESSYFSVAFWIRMLYSCLVDADFLDTEQFVNYGVSYRDSGESPVTLLSELSAYIQGKKWLEGKTGINKLRSDVLQNCIEKGKNCKTGLYSLTVPTGGGKTIASLAFAMHHAVAAGKQRIIYVIPYCSIIDQTVETFTKIFGAENVLAHYSNAEFLSDASDEIRHNSRLLATENWDKPIIVTTAVQFFESLFANRSSQCRKLHNIANAVVIFDEAQTLPLPYLKPCIATIVELIENYRTTCLLCTATQPALNRFFENYYEGKQNAAISIDEICPNTDELYQALQRVTYEKIGKQSDEELAEKLGTYDQVLCIVTTRKQASNVYEMMEPEGTYHLSKNMTAEHIKSTIERIRLSLKEGKTCRVISTSLIEAGVDLDFPTVFCAKAGLDSIIQAAGRCNREGKNAASDSKVFVFEPEKQYITHLPAELLRPVNIMDTATEDESDIADRRVVNRYFNILYNNLDGNSDETTDGLDCKHILEGFSAQTRMMFSFADIAKDFKLIEDNTISVFVPQDTNSKKLAEKLMYNKKLMSKNEYREMGKYCVNVYFNTIEKIRSNVVVINEHFAVLVNEELYDSKTGLQLNDEGGRGIIC